MPAQTSTAAIHLAPEPLGGTFGGTPLAGVDPVLAQVMVLQETLALPNITPASLDKVATEVDSLKLALGHDLYTDLTTRIETVAKRLKENTQGSSDVRPPPPHGAFTPRT